MTDYAWLGLKPFAHSFSRTYTTLFIATVFLAMTATALFYTPAVNAQTLSNRSDLEQNFQDELNKWMLFAYEGDAEAQFKVGVLFANEQLEQPDPEQAVYWYKQAARQGHTLAQYNLGHHFLIGNGVEQNEANAIEWWLKAAQNDHALAQFNIGRAFYLGIGTTEDHEKSRYWFTRAAQNKEPKSIEILNQLGWADTASMDTPDTIKQPDDTRPVSTPDSETGVSRLPADSQFKSRISPAPDSIDQPNNIAVAEINTETALNDPETSSSGKVVTTPVALYTDPSIRSVLITMIEERDKLEIINTSKDWVTVKSPTGFPVWIHENFLDIAGDTATVTGNNVNARSVPIISNGTIVGAVNKGVTLKVLDQRDSWSRVMSPASFSAWIKTEDYNQPAILKELDEPKESEAQSNIATDDTASDATINDNEWLFSQNKDHLTLQLASFDDEQKVNEFLSRGRYRNNSNIHRFTATSKDIVWTYFLYGSYENRSDAEVAKLEIDQNRAWIRSFGRLQENRCLSWKTKLPTPPELNRYCSQ